MNNKTSFDLPDQMSKKDDLSLPSFSNCFESVLNKGELLQVDGTNVVRAVSYTHLTLPTNREV